MLDIEHLDMLICWDFLSEYEQIRLEELLSKACIA